MFMALRLILMFDKACKACYPTECFKILLRFVGFRRLVAWGVVIRIRSARLMDTEIHLHYTVCDFFYNHNHWLCRWFAHAPLGLLPAEPIGLIEFSFCCRMRPTAIEIAAWRILCFSYLSIIRLLNCTLLAVFQTCSSLRSDIFPGHS